MPATTAAAGRPAVAVVHTLVSDGWLSVPIEGAYSPWKCSPPYVTMPNSRPTLWKHFPSVPWLAPLAAHKGVRGKKLPSLLSNCLWVL